MLLIWIFFKEGLTLIFVFIPVAVDPVFSISYMMLLGSMDVVILPVNMCAAFQQHILKPFNYVHLINCVIHSNIHNNNQYHFSSQIKQPQIKHLNSYLNLCNSFVNKLYIISNSWKLKLLYHHEQFSVIFLFNGLLCFSH